MAVQVWSLKMGMSISIAISYASSTFDVLMEGSPFDVLGGGSTFDVLREVHGVNVSDGVFSKSARGSRNCTTLPIGGRSSGVRETHLQAISIAVASSWCGAVSRRYLSTASSSRPFSRKLLTWSQTREIKHVKLRSVTWLQQTTHLMPCLICSNWVRVVHYPASQVDMFLRERRVCGLAPAQKLQQNDAIAVHIGLLCSLASARILCTAFPAS
jgi:hypothetical protein